MKSIAIIGAGVSGLSAIKCCLDEGLEPVCFELSADVGGIWKYTEAVHDRQACVIKSTVANLSKEMMCYSDFPPDKEVPIFMHNSDALKYFKKYASHHKLLSRIQFKTEVLDLIKARLRQYEQLLSTFKPNGICYSYQLDQSFSVLRVVMWYLSL